MEFNVFNNNKEQIGIVDNFSEAIWVNRFYDVGEFEIYIGATQKNIDLLREDYFLTKNDDETVMVIESIETRRNMEEGQKLIVKGRSLPSILDRRLVWKQTTLYGSVEDCLYTIINQNCMQAGVRQIPGLKMLRKGTFLQKYEKQTTGDTILDVVIDLCQAEKCGFKMVFDDDKNFIFSLYQGVDRSYKQNVNPWVVFSPEFENLAEDTYFKNLANHKNVALVAGEGEGDERQLKTVNDLAYSGLTRRELYVDARDISSNDGSITPTDYANLLVKRGEEKLGERVITETVSGTVEATKNRVVNKDYFLGDVVQIQNQFGIGVQSRIIELLEYESEAGYKIIPKFSDWE